MLFRSSVKLTISLNRGNLTCNAHISLYFLLCSSSWRLRTFSRMTSGPLTPPIVLYRMRGVTDIMRGSTSSPLAMAAVSCGREPARSSEVFGSGDVRVALQVSAKLVRPRCGVEAGVEADENEVDGRGRAGERPASSAGRALRAIP